MDVRFVRVDLSEIHTAVQQHLEALSRPIDSFLEDHILESTHYRILVGAAPAGFASIHRANLITQFCLVESCKRWGQAVFQQLRKWESVGAAFVPTSDEFFLAHALDDYRRLAKQAYFFTVGRDTVDPAVTRGYSLRQAAPGDASFIQQQSGGFFEHLERQIQAGEILLTHRDGSGVGFGVLVKSRFYRDVASIGMYTIEPYRNSGVGTATIALLAEECERRGLRAVAGCWYYNHSSKRTLERAGMMTQTRLLKIEY
jgi:RimJ/RimL family protein N-acetyltransferase